MINIQLASEDWVNSGKTWENVVNTVKSIKYGRLYNWYAATDVRGIAPTGWHVPSEDDWQMLVAYAGGSSIAGEKLKEAGTAHWSEVPNNGTDNFNFKGIPTGHFAYGFFNYLEIYGQIAEFQSSTNEVLLASYYGLNAGTNNIISNAGGNSLNHDFGRAIRYIKDDSINEGSVTDIDGNVYHTVTIGTQVWCQENAATLHYQNGDLILSDFSGTVGAVCAYNNDETNVYDIVTTPDPTHIEPILSKMIYVNAVDFKSLVEYPDNATAISAGLTAGQLYTTTGSLKIVYLIAP